ncbi:hypothetical protein Q4E93_19555 [Flavitalea sp. BT771]|uniref:hypothetical protein n=1 Tax=Flavitalea sp. BT771 TaxID=3063329 RepID=UPI0026E15960|nr:hypothetical protein [Flavitalea sp. BT771]MDO6432813.1 hypothetical protein [Flavitalea sp. BT771]MDV6221911.1 hypothetical protein [Flavitalea sp. BT771]
MKAKLQLLVAFMLLFSFVACRKAISDTSQQASASTHIDSRRPTVQTDTAGGSRVAYPAHPLTGCFPAPLYGDSVIYPQPTGGADNIVSLVNDPGPGHYFSWPAGLSLNQHTGAINISKSETGQRYAIGYVKDGTHDTCLSTLIIGGADYMDSVYVLGNGATIAVPYFDANAYQASDCSGPGNSGHCSFDVNGSATSQNIFIDKFSGEINLDKTLNGDANTPGAFGSAPVNGATVDAVITYSLKKHSNSAPQSIHVSLRYYDSMSQVDPAIMAVIQMRMINIMSGNLLSYSYNPRPPLIVIVRR